MLYDFPDNARLKKMSTKYNVTYPDGSKNTIVADEDFAKKVTAGGGSYELIAKRDPTDDEIAYSHRTWRNGELSSTDFVVPLTDHPQRSAIMTYRQELRDWPSTDAFGKDGVYTRPTLS